MKRCCNCNKFIYFASVNDWCGCEEVKVWIPSQGETEKNAKTRFTKDGEELASEIAEDFYNDDPSDPTKFKETICVKGIQGGIETFEVTAEVNIDFSARSIV